MDKDFSSTKVRMPAVLVPAYNALMKTSEGSAAMKRIKVGCGICKSIKCYAITRGVTRVATVIACENCRHFYQKIRRDPVSLDCIAEEKASCYRNETFLETKCKACWAMRLLDCCPHDVSVYDSISKLLSDDCKEVIRGFPIMPEDLPEDSTGSLALEVLKDDLWVPAPSGEEEDIVKSSDELSSHGDSNSADTFDRSDEIPTEDSSKNNPNSVAHTDSSKVFHKDFLIESMASKSVNDDSEKSLSKTSSKTVSKTVTKEIFSQGLDSEIADIDDEASMETSPKVVDAENLTENTSFDHNDPDQTKMTFNFATISSQDFDDVEMDDDELNVDDPAPVNMGIVTRRKKESTEEDNLTLKKSERIKRKRKKVEYFNKPIEQKSGRRMKGLIHGPNGALLKNGKDLCDCLQEDCLGCHFPCPKCRSPKCGNECRVNRRWYYEKVEVEGTKISFTNKFAPKI